MKFEAVKTSIYQPSMDIIKFIDENVRGSLKEGDVLAITSKIVSLSENAFAPASESKEDLVKREADQFLGEIGYGCYLTIKDGLLIASAGIDESNSEGGQFILYPEDPYLSAQNILYSLKKLFKLKKIGVILTDSHTIPLRRGVTGITLSYAGFKAVKNMVGSKDLFGRELMMTSMNIVDGLSSTATLMMGEGAESCPLVIIKGADVDFVEKVDPQELAIDFKEDLYYPLYKNLMEKK